MYQLTDEIGQYYTNIFVLQVKQVDILISKNQALRILYLSSIVPCIIIINFIVYNDTVLQCSTQTYLI